MAKRTQPTRPDLNDDMEWLVWIAALPENEGIDVHALFEKLIVWCSRNGHTPTRRRLLRWLVSEREAVPMKYNQTFIRGTQDVPRPTPAAASYNCDRCFDDHTVMVEADAATRSFAGEMVEIPCPHCSNRNG